MFNLTFRRVCLVFQGCCESEKKKLDILCNRMADKESVFVAYNAIRNAVSSDISKYVPKSKYPFDVVFKNATATAVTFSMQ